jgi:hypothetical protein
MAPAPGDVDKVMAQTLRYVDYESGRKRLA